MKRVYVRVDNYYYTYKLQQGIYITIVPYFTETAMGTQLSKEATGAGRSYKEAIYQMGHLFVYRFTRVYLFADFLFFKTAAGKKMKHYLRTIHGFTKRVINDRREYVRKHGVKIAEIEDKDDVYKKKKTAMLDLLLLAEKDGLIDDVGIQEEVDTFMFEVKPLSF